jgi:hypothetical protein
VGEAARGVHPPLRAAREHDLLDRGGARIGHVDRLSARPRVAERLEVAGALRLGRQRELDRVGVDHAGRRRPGGFECRRIVAE